MLGPLEEPVTERCFAAPLKRAEFRQDFACHGLRKIDGRFIVPQRGPHAQSQPPLQHRQVRYEQFLQGVWLLRGRALHEVLDWVDHRWLPAGDCGAVLQGRQGEAEFVEVVACGPVLGGSSLRRCECLADLEPILH